MLTLEPDTERALESIFYDSIPFILFAPDEFREELIMRLKGLYSNCNPRTTDKFIEEQKRINEMLTDYNFGELINVHIAHLQSKMKPVNQTLAEHSLRLKELESQVKSLRRYNKRSPKIKSTNFENIISNIDSQPPLDDIKVIGDELKSTDEKITDQTSPVANPTENKEIKISKKSLARLQRTNLWDMLLLLRSKDNCVSAIELADTYNVPKQKIYEAIHRLNQIFKNNIRKNKDEHGNRTYQWVETEESKEFFNKLGIV